LTTYAQKGGLEFEKRGGSCAKKEGLCHGQWATNAHPLAVTCSQTDYRPPLFCNFLIFKNLFLEVWRLTWHFGDWVYSTPIFKNLPLYLEVFNLPFLMVLGDFIFFQIFLLKLENTWTFISTVGIFVS
jgi:hypothetical protein